MSAVEFTILSIEQDNFTGDRDEEGTRVPRMHFLINPTTDMTLLPDCLPGSTAGDVVYYTQPTNASAVFKMKDNDGTWKPE
jgi:hypothetical protein